MLSDCGLRNTYKEFSAKEIFDAIFKLKVCKAPECDGITSEYVKHAEYIFVIALHKLLNMCIAHGYVPNNYTSSVMVPILKDKSGNCTTVSNYRPISLINMFARVFEFCIDIRLAEIFRFDGVQNVFVTIRKTIRKTVTQLDKLRNC